MYPQPTTFPGSSGASFSGISSVSGKSPSPASARGNLQEDLHLVGAQSFDIMPGYGCGQAIEAVLPEIAGRAMEILKEWDVI